LLPQKSSQLLHCFVSHYAVGGVVGVGVRVLQDDTVRRRWWLIPLRDAIHFVIWLAVLLRTGSLGVIAQFYHGKGQMIPVRDSQYLAKFSSGGWLTDFHSRLTIKDESWLSRSSGTRAIRFCCASVGWEVVNW